jgi:predicted transcriptional regulator
MSQRKKILLEKPLTEVELELMNSIWNLGECTVKEVQKSLPPGRNLAYTSVATMMKILEQKGVLSSRKNDRAHTYCALISRSEYEGQSLRHMADNLFQGDPTSMVMRLLNDNKLSSEELKTIRDLLDQRLEK